MHQNKMHEDSKVLRIQINNLRFNKINNLDFLSINFDPPVCLQCCLTEIQRGNNASCFPLLAVFVLS